jgi:hypothetical protein
VQISLGKPAPTKVEVGQIWESMDPRFKPRRMQVVRLYEERGDALCILLDSGRFRTIKLKRFVPRTNGYRLIRKESLEKLPPGAPEIP